MNDDTKHRFDVMEGVNCPMRVAQWVTREKVDEYCQRTGRVVVSERRIGLVLSEVTVCRGTRA